MRHYVPVILAVLMLAPALHAVPTGAGVVTLVDGTELRGEILFKHPNADCLVVRSAGNRTLQSVAMPLIHQVQAGGEQQAVNPRRALTDAERQARELNGLWGDAASEKRIGRYAAQDWPARPVIVWRYPGKSGNAMSAESWLDERGQPLKASPWTETDFEKRWQRSGEFSKPGYFDGDVLLPAADQQYKAIQPGKRDYLSAMTVRHLTIEANASYNVRYTIEGNLWLKHEGDLGGGTQTGGFGNPDAAWHTVARFCGDRWPQKKASDEGESEWIAISHWIHIHTGGTIEVVGQTGGAGDRLTLSKGTLVISEDSHIGNGPRGSFYNEQGTTVIFLDGAGAGCLDKVLRGRGGTYGFGGTVMFGAPDHPLTRDLRVEMALFNAEDIDPNATPAQRTKGASMVLGPTGTMITHSADPDRARVIFCPRPDDAPYSSYAVGDRAQGREMPTGIAAVFAGQTQLDGVVFDGFLAGGIVVDPQAARRWKHVSFGEHNQAPPDQLFRDIGKAP